MRALLADAVIRHTSLIQPSLADAKARHKQDFHQSVADEASPLATII
jgi:hypothetical protein